MMYHHAIVRMEFKDSRQRSFTIKVSNQLKLIEHVLFRISYKLMCNSDMYFYPHCTYYFTIHCARFSHCKCVGLIHILL